MAKPLEGKKILLIGKAPPIQGGVSISTLLTAVDLANLGCQVHFLSNRLDVEAGYRQIGARSFETHPNLNFFDVQMNSVLFHIPYSPVFTERLTGRALSLMETYDYDLVIGWYLVPYGTAAALAATINKKPFFLVHAGSDLNRLTLDEDIKSIVAHCLKQATAVITPKSAQAFKRLNCLAAPLSNLKVYTKALPMEFPRAEKAFASLREAIISLSLEATRSNTFGANWMSINSEWLANADQFPTFIMYGKLSASRKPNQIKKLIADIASSNKQFTALFVLSGDQTVIEPLQKYFVDEKLSMNIKFLPPVSPETLCNLLELSDLGICIEEGFDVSLHLSRIPRELMFHGIIPVVSKSFLAQPFYRDILIPEINCVVLDGISDGARIAALIESPERMSDLKASVAITSRHVENKVGKLNPISKIIQEYLEEENG